MLFTYLFWASVFFTAAVITVSVAYLTKDSLKSLVIENISDAEIATITEIIQTSHSVTAPKTVKLNVKCINGSTREMDIKANKSDYFYKNQKIRIR